MQQVLESVGDYQTTELVHRGTSSLIYRARHRTSQENVVLKCLRRSNPTPDQVSWFIQEYEMAQSLQAPGIVELQGLEWNEKSPFMIFSDTGGQSLDRVVAKGSLSPIEALDLGCKLVETLSGLHDRGIVHRDINPSNIIADPDGGISIIDFASATILRQEQATFGSLSAIEGTLAYIAPEQTGRTNRPVDYRSDYYSLGVTLYELVTGHRPFDGANAMEVVHAHLAATPIAPVEHNPQIPKSASDVILKLIAKEPEDRYRSAKGLVHDLRRCIEIASSPDPASSFELQRQDTVNRLEFSHRLYGREVELASLMTAFRRARERTGQAELFVVGGFSGIGKTALIREIEKPVTLSNGYFVGGKFDQYRRDLPYSGILQALRDLVQMISSESDGGARWKSRILTALGWHGRIATDMIPGLEALIGEQATLPELSPSETEALTTNVLVDLLRVLSDGDRPLVVFLDDLQWIDAASISLLKALMDAGGMGQLLLITAYRSNETGPSHRFSQLREDIEAERGQLSSIELPPLSVDSVSEMLADALYSSPEEVSSLASLVRQTTVGNPFFIHQFMARLCRDQLVRFDADAMAWRWEVDEIDSHNVIDNVVDLMAAEIGGANNHTKAALQMAACMGNRFELSVLARLCGLSVREVADRLWPALENGWVVPLGRHHRLMRLSRYAIPNEFRIECRFSHDRVHEAVYESVDRASQRQNHWKIGQFLLEGLAASQNANLILDVASQLNLGGDDETMLSHRNELMKVNLAAGQRAKDVGAHAASLEYFENGLRVCRDVDWIERPDVIRALHEGGAEAAYLVGAREKTDAWVATLLNRAESATHRTVAMEIRIRAALLADGQQAAVKLGLSALAELGVELPAATTPADMDAAIADVKSALADRRVSDLSELPLMEDSDDLATMRLFHSMLSSTYASSPDLFVVVTSRMVRMSIERGLSSMSIVAFADFAIVLCGRRDEFELGYDFGRLSLELVEKLSSHEVEARVSFMFYSFVHHWTEHLSGAFEPLKEAFQTGMETGDAQYAALSAFDYGFNLFWLGGSLTHAERELERFDEAIISTGQDWIRNLHLMYRQAVACLTSSTRVDATLSGEHLNADDLIPKLEAAKASNALVQIRILRLMLNYIFGSYSAARAESEAARPHLSGVTATAAIPGFHFFTALSILASAKERRNVIDRSTVEALETSRGLLRLWAERSPTNYRHKHLLVEAEVARLEGRDEDARPLFEEAIELAHENGFQLEEALACERAGRFYLAIGRRRQARHYLRDAYDTWSQCGALAKLRSLDAEIHPLLDEAGERPGGSGGQLTTTDLDFSSIISATQAISMEIVLSRLLERLMTVLIENAGATRGVLILRGQKGWEIAADGHSRSQTVEVRAHESQQILRDETGAPMSLIELAAGSREDVIIHDVRDDPVLMADPYIQRSTPKAVLCHPIERQSEVMGVLYLENDLMTGAFSKQRIEVLKPLCAQAAISIDNAKLHEHQVHLTEAANRFVPNQLAKVLGRENLAEVCLGDHAEREMALVVTDIRGFTSIAENLSPQEVFEFVNTYVQATDPAFRENGGIVIKYMGDSQMAVFPDSAEDAVRSAIGIFRRLDDFNSMRTTSGLPPIRIGVGLHVGYTMLGIVGEAERCQLDILSDTVNLVARIEKLTRTFGSNTLISDAVLAQIDENRSFETRFLGNAKIKGRRDTVGIHELIDAESAEQRSLRIQTRAEFEEGVGLLFDGKFSEAEAALKDVLMTNPDDTAAALLLSRVGQFSETADGLDILALEAP